MTIEEVAELPYEKLKALTKQQLDEILSPYYKVTRPELAGKKEKKSNVTPVANPFAGMSEAKRQALLSLQEEGVDLSSMFRKKKK